MVGPKDGEVVPAAAGVLRDLRLARRRRRTADFDAFEALYRAYLAAIVGTIAVLLLAGVVGDQRVGPAELRDIRSHGPALVGAVVALVWAVGARSGGRGGPLVLEAADVRHVLMAPVGRAPALRPAAWRQLRFGALAGAVAGATAGVLAAHRLPGGTPAWALSGASDGAATVVGALGAAMIVSGRRAGRPVAALAGAGLIAWSGLDVASATATSPASAIGAVALWPLRSAPGALWAPALAVGLAAAGVASVGGTAIGDAERRASLVGQIRFAATLRDLRTVVVLRRQLAQEEPRDQPWLHRRRRGGTRPLGWAGWRRSAQGLRRFPAVRVARLVLLGAAAGACAVGVWRGTTPLIAVAAVALFAAGLEAAEPVAQELDHAERRLSLPERSGDLLLRLCGPPLLVMVAVAALGAGLAVGLAGASGSSVAVAALAVAPAASCGLAGALISIVQGAPSLSGFADSSLSPEMAGSRLVARTLWPGVVAAVGMLPVLLGRPAVGAAGPAGGSPSRAVAGAVAALLLAAAVGLWVRYRDALHAALRGALAAGDARRPPRPASPAGR